MLIDTSEQFMDIYNRLQKIHVQLDDGDRRTLAYFELTSPQYHALLHLHDAYDVGLTVTQLADRLICTRGNATRLVRRLEAQDLVAVGGDPTDRRVVRITLTEKGESLFRISNEAHISSVRERFMALSDHDAEQLAELTRKLVDLLDWNLHG